MQSNDLALAVFDSFPISPGHALILPKRHIGSLFDTSPREISSLWELLNSVKDLSKKSFRPDGYNIGVNDGTAAGQTIAHLHIHLIPRYHGDRPDPRGGIRWVIPEKADYWSEQ